MRCVALALLLVLPACTVTTTLVDPPTFAANPDKHKTEMAVKAAIAERGWRIEAQPEGRVQAVYQFEPVRTAKVLIAWDPNTVRVSYLDSDGLNYASVTGTYATIDPRYNDAVDNLARAIQLQLLKLK